MTSREAMLLMKYKHYGKCKGSSKDSRMKCKYMTTHKLFSNILQIQTYFTSCVSILCQLRLALVRDLLSYNSLFVGQLYKINHSRCVI